MVRPLALAFTAIFPVCTALVLACSSEGAHPPAAGDCVGGETSCGMWGVFNGGATPGAGAGAGGAIPDGASVNGGELEGGAQALDAGAAGNATGDANAAFDVGTRADVATVNTDGSTFPPQGSLGDASSVPPIGLDTGTTTPTTPGGFGSPTTPTTPGGPSGPINPVNPGSPDFPDAFPFSPL